MSEFFRNVTIDQFSFWAGFVAGAIFLWILRKLSPSIRQGWNNSAIRKQEKQFGKFSQLESRFLNDLLRYTQRLHLASMLFSLDEVIVIPRLMESPQSIEAINEDRLMDIVSLTLPYTPDWPQLAATYSANTISLAQALSGGANLVVIGQPGSGKTIALAHLASQIVKRDPETEHLEGFLPVFVHVADLLPSEKYSTSPAAHIRNGLRTYIPSLNESQLNSIIDGAIQKEKVLLLVDGLDEAPPDLYGEVLAFLKTIRNQFPLIRIVISASPGCFCGLLELGFIPVSIATWGTKETYRFIENWRKLWSRFIVPNTPEGQSTTNALLLNPWLSDSNTFNTPLEITLKVWAGFAGDTLGSHPTDNIESYLRRCTSKLPKAREALEELALQLIAKQKIASSPKDLRGWDGLFATNEAGEYIDSKTVIRANQKRNQSLRSLTGVFPEIQEYGLLKERQGGRLSFNNPVITSYLAACALAEAPVIHFLSNQPEWSGKTLTLIYLAGLGDVSSEANEYLNKTGDLLDKSLLTVGRWLRFSQKGSTWRTRALRSLAKSLQEDNRPVGLQFRLIAILLESGDPGTSVLLRQLLTSSQSDLRRLAALGLGAIRDQAAINNLIESMNDSNRTVVSAACLALTSIGTKPALEALASMLLHGNEDQRRLVAEALAYDETEGHPILKDGSEIDDLLVRRAVVYGLAHVNQPWALQTLDKLAVDDQQWVVRAAATQVLEDLTQPTPCIPRPNSPLNETSWMIDFASRRGVGVAPGKPSQDLMLKVLEEGELDLKLSALDYLKFSPIPDAIPKIISIYNSSDSGLKQAAYETLWYYASSGLNINGPEA